MIISFYMIISCMKMQQECTGDNNMCARVQDGSHKQLAQLPVKMNRVGQNHIYTVYIRYTWLGDH